MDAPTGIAISQARRFFALFGLINSVDEIIPTPQLGRIFYQCQYTHPASAVLANDVSFESPLGELHLHGQINKAEEETLRQEVESTREDEGTLEGETDHWWKLEAGKRLGSAEAEEKEKARLTASNLQAMQNTSEAMDTSK